MTDLPIRKAHDLHQAAEMLAGVSVDFLRKEHRAGRIAFKKLGKKYVVSDAELDRYVDDLESAPPRWHR